jgi:hypothetical protein
MQPLAAAIAAVAFFVAALSAYVTHVVWAIKLLMIGTAPAGQLVLCVLGTVIPPIGSIHGLIIWFS